MVRPLTELMYQSIRVLKVFLASPSDVGPEREAAHRVVGEINASVGRELNWRVELLVWEDVGPDYARKIDRASRSTSRPKTATLRMRWSDSWANSETLLTSFI